LYKSYWHRHFSRLCTCCPLSVWSSRTPRPFRSDVFGLKACILSNIFHDFPPCIIVPGYYLKLGWNCFFLILSGSLFTNPIVRRCVFRATNMVVK
jgi:hypothetical protein